MPTSLHSETAPRPVAEPERSLFRAGLRTIGVVTPVAVTAAALVRGVSGAVTAFGAGALLAGWLAASALPSAWAARRGPGMLLGVALGGFAARIAALAIAIVVLGPVDSIDGPVLAITVAVGLIALLATEIRELIRHNEYWWVQPDARSDTAGTQSAPPAAQQTDETSARRQQRTERTRT